MPHAVLRVKKYISVIRYLHESEVGDHDHVCSILFQISLYYTLEYYSLLLNYIRTRAPHVNIYN